MLNICPFVLELNPLTGNCMTVDDVECKYIELENMYLFKPKHEIPDDEYRDLHGSIKRLVNEGVMGEKLVFVLSYDFDVFTTKIKDKAKEGN